MPPLVPVSSGGTGCWARSSMWARSSVMRCWLWPVQQVRFHVATHLHQIRLLRRQGLLQSREQRAQRIEPRRLLGGRPFLL